MTAVPRSLIVNADDFGQSAGINRGVIEAYERGIVTSASVMVCWPAAAAAASYARAHPWLSVGLHFDLGEWTFRDGGWHTIYMWVDPDDSSAVEREARMQLERYRDLLGHDPTHLDSHQHIHRRAGVHEALERIAAELQVPLRHCSSVHHCGDFYGQSQTGEPLPHLIAATTLAAMLRGLPAGVTELGCHPGYADDVESMYRAERRIELRTLCANEIRLVIADEQIRLVSFCDVHGR